MSLADAVLACDEASVRLEPAVSGDVTGLQFKWSDGTQSASLEAIAAGKFWVEVSNVCQKIRHEAMVRWNDFGGDTS